MRGDKAQPGGAPQSRARALLSRAVTSRDWGPSLALSALLLALALALLPRAIQAGDAGEFATIMLTGGVPHPSGYPWMRLLGLPARLLWRLGVAPASAAALPAALAGVAAWVVLHRCCVAVLEPGPQSRPADRPQPAPTWAGCPRAWASALLIAIVACSPLVTSHTIDSEVWGLHLLSTALFLLGLTRARNEPRPLRLGLWFGLAVSHHLTAVLLLPLAVGAAWPRPERQAQPQPEPADSTTWTWLRALSRNGALGVVGGVLGLTPWLTLPIGTGGGWRWGEVQTLQGLTHHLLRRDYGTFSLSLHEDQVAPIDTVARTLASLGEVLSAASIDNPWFGAACVLTVAGAAGAGVWSSLRPGTHTRPPLPASILAGLILSLATTCLAFPAAQNIDPSSPFGAWILERFDLLPLMLLTWGAALILVRLQAGLSRMKRPETERSTKLLRAGAWALGIVALAAQLGATTAQGGPASERGVEIAAVDLLESSALAPAPAASLRRADGEPLRAVVFGTDDHRSFPVLYASEVLGAGSHTLYIDAQLLAHPWYRARLRARVPDLPDTDKPLRLIGAIWSDPRFDATPLYLANIFSTPAGRLPRVPEGLLWRIPPPPDHPRFDPDAWTPEAILSRHLTALDACEARPEHFAGREHPRAHPWSAELRTHYLDVSRAAAGLAVRAGALDKVEAIDAALRLHIGVGLD